MELKKSQEKIASHPLPCGRGLLGGDVKSQRFVPNVQVIFTYEEE
jgi:hypothetical protein